MSKFNSQKLSRRKFLQTAAVIGGGAALAACAAPTATPAPAKPAEPAKPAAPAVSKPVDLRVAWWGSQDRHDRTIKVIDMYMKKNPNVKITYEFAGFNDHLTKMTTQAAGNQLPDIMQQDYAWISEWAGRGLIIPLDNFATSGALNFKDVSEDFLKGGRVGGKLVAINLGSNSQCFSCDQGDFEKAGLALPKDDWTWDDFEKTAMTIKEKAGKWAVHGLYGEQLWKSLYLSLGEWSYNSEGTGIGYKDDAPFVKYLSMLLRLQKAGVIPSRAEDLSSFDGKSVEQQPLALGKAAMDSHWSNQVVAVQKAAGDNRTIRMAPLPRPAGGKSSNYIKPSQFFSITRDSKAPEEAAKFIDFFTNDSEANDILFAERGVPISAKVREALIAKLGKAQKEMFDYVARVSKIAEPIRPADPPGHADLVKNVFNPQVIDAVMFEKTKPEDAAALLRKEVNTVLAKNKK
jgi:multiple sugar transport system substrate-binding protein